MKFKENQYLPRYEQVGLSLEKEIKSLKPGERVAPIREIMRKFNVSQATVDKCLSVLSEKGLIDRIPGRGIFVSNEREILNEGLLLDLCFFYEKKVLNENHLYHNMVLEMMKEADSSDCHLNICPCNSSIDVQSFKYRLKRHGVSVAILMCVTRGDYEIALQSEGIPVILLFPNAVNDSSISVKIDSVGGTKSLLDHLFELGHERIAYLHGQGYHGYYNLAQEERLSTYYTYLKEKGIVVSPDFVRFGGYTPEEGYQATKELLKGQVIPTAVVCNDYNALGVINAIKDSGRKVPDDISVIGFDDAQLPYEIKPALTTVSIGWENISRCAIRISCDLIDNKTFKGQTILTPTELVIRETTAKAPS